MGLYFERALEDENDMEVCWHSFVEHSLSLERQCSL